MLNIICGEAGTGKTTELFKRIAETAVSGGKAVLFVPDQFSFEAEKLVYKTVPHEFSRNVRVTMFSREAQKILHLYGKTKEYADDIAKHIVMKRALEECSANGELVYYRRQAAKQGFPSFALGMMSDMRGAGISPAELRKRLAEETFVSDVLAGKLNDISAIYTAYDCILTENFDDRLDDIRRAAEIISQTDIFDGYEVFFDEFDSFSGNQTGFIRTLLSKADNVTVALTCDYPECKDRKFDAVNRLIGQLAGDGEKNITVMRRKYRECKDIQITEARDMWQECDWICAEIRSLMDGGARCRDIAVIAPGSEYVRILGSAMKRYDIPAFADIPEPLITKSFVRFAIYTLKALSFGTEDILRYVKSGFVRHSDGKVISNIQTDSLEKLCRTYDLRKRDWLKEFPEKLDNGGSLEALRRSIIDPLTELKNSLEDSDGAEMTKQLCSFICDKMDIYRTIYGKCIIGRDEKGNIIVDRAKLDEYSEIWDDTVTVFESAHKALAGCTLPLAEFTEILTEIFTSETVSKPPQVLDAVTVGDPERSRFGRVKYLFICGNSSGVMPPPARTSAVFTASESEQLSLLGIPVTSDRLSRYSQEQFTLYRCLNIPEQKLYLTYSLLNGSGNYPEPSGHIAEICEKAHISVDGADTYGAEHYCRTQKSAERYLAAIYNDRSKTAERRELIKLVPKSFRDMLKSASGEYKFTDRRIISKEHAERLLKLSSYSPTAITQLGRCKFAFFCKYGLGLRDDGERDISVQLVGTVVHFCLQRLLSDHRGKREDFIALTDADIAAHVAESTAIFERENYFGGFGGAERFSYLLKRLGIYAVKAAVRIRDETKLSGFYPEALEHKLSFDFGDITIYGVCDRIDSMEKDGKKYIRVVDYKHGKPELKLDDIYRGENLQMLLYLFGICEAEGAYPSSVMYLPFGKISYESSDGSDTKEKAAKSMQNYMSEHSLSGLILSDSPEKADIDAITADLTARFGPKRGKGYINTTEVTPEVYNAIKSYCRSYIGSKAAEAAAGMTSACPSGANACDYCEFGLFCGRKTG